MHYAISYTVRLVILLLVYDLTAHTTLYLVELNTPCSSRKPRRFDTGVICTSSWPKQPPFLVSRAPGCAGAFPGPNRSCQVRSGGGCKGVRTRPRARWSSVRRQLQLEDKQTCQQWLSQWQCHALYGTRTRSGESDEERFRWAYRQPEKLRQVRIYRGCNAFLLR